MRVEQLKQYEESERAIVGELGAAAAPDGYVSNARALYADLRLPRRLGFQRTQAPLSALLFLYETVVVYVPPMSQKTLESRLGMTWGDFIGLCHAGIIQPVIGHPTHYARRPFFNDLFALRPPSVWARGDELAHQFANAAEYWDIARSEMQAERMVSVPWVRAKFRRHFPTLDAKSLDARIAVELRTNFVDLCIFGYEPLAREVISSPDLAWSAVQVLQLAEVFAYPGLLGMGGVPNYGLRQRAAIHVASRSVLLGDHAGVEIGPEAQLLVEGLGLSLRGRPDVESLRRFHENDLSPRLWRALNSLERQVSQEVDDPQDLVAISTQAQAVLAETMRMLDRTPNSWRRQNAQASDGVELALKLGSGTAITAAAHILGVEWVAAAGAGLGSMAIFETAAAKRASRRLESALHDALARKRYGDLAVQLWWIRRLAS